MSIKFGPSGNSDSFYKEGFKSSLDMPKWLCKMGLDAYEYNCTKGVNIKQESAEKLGKNASLYKIFLSVHSQYYISLSSPKEEMRGKSVRYILECLKCARWLGAKRIVVHSGGVSKLTRSQAMQFASETLKTAIVEAKSYGYDDIAICPETMGKINQLGDISEVIELCKIDESFIPAIDFGHLNARTHGGIRSEADYADILDQFINGLGIDRMKQFHCHFSKIEYTQGGEKQHLTFEDREFGPDYEPFLDMVYKKNLSPVIICESAGTMAEDALQMKRYYNLLKGTKLK